MRKIHEIASVAAKCGVALVAFCSLATAASAGSRVLLENAIESQNQCVVWVQGTVLPALRAAGAQPANKVLDLDGITVWRLVTTDGPVTATCSGPDRKFVLQSHS